MHLPLCARVRYRGLRGIRWGIGIDERGLPVRVIYPTLIVLGLGLSVLFRIIKGGSSADHARWGLGGVSSRTGMVGSSRQGTVVVGRGRGERRWRLL